MCKITPNPTVGCKNNTTMSRRYDGRTTTFSPEGIYTYYIVNICYCAILGRLFQVEYAMEAINNAGSAVGILTDQCIVIAGK